MTMAHQPLAAVFGLSVSVAAKEGCDLRLDGLRQQRPRTLAQNFGERVGELCWLDQLDGIILGHGVSLLWWRSGGSNTPTIRPLTPSRRHQLPRIPRAQGARWLRRPRRDGAPACRCPGHGCAARSYHRWRPAWARPAKSRAPNS